MTNDKVSIERLLPGFVKHDRPRGLTQAEVAKKAGISENHYAQIERAEKNPSVSTLQDIIKAIGVSSAEILDK